MILEHKNTDTIDRKLFFKFVSHLGHVLSTKTFHENEKNVQKEKVSNNQDINNQSSKASSSHKLVYSSIEQRRCHDVDLSDQEVTDNTSKKCSVSAKSSLNSIGRGTEPKDEYNAIKYSLQRVERSLADIKFNLHHLTEQFEITRNNLNSNVNHSRERCPMPNNTLSKMSFPLKTVEEIELLQFILTSNEEGIKESMFNMLAAIGGSSYEEMSKRMFIYVFTNEAASAYNWVGEKGKRKLHHFELMKIMLNVVRKTFPNVTKKEFEIKCKDWFRHAKHRAENEKLRQTNLAKQNQPNIEKTN
ncbi:uncharacterized protein LOC113004498 [Solenopsis invicta]|uniref:uncharacterized protein LOC113004498 n=1 Tax=Solenopsis invicta TaxID=13686 RepID=UPI00193C8B53|nr:uncharacterized protein LOC113004498 [Solenopsis invicta]